MFLDIHIVEIHSYFYVCSPQYALHLTTMCLRRGILGLITHIFRVNPADLLVFTFAGMFDLGRLLLHQ